MMATAPPAPPPEESGNSPSGESSSPPPPAPREGGSSDSFSASYVRELREENKRRRHEYRDAREALEQTRTDRDTLLARLSELVGEQNDDDSSPTSSQLADRVADHVAQLERAAHRATENAISVAFRAEAERAGAQHVDDALRLANLAEMSIDPETGIVRGMEEAITSLRTERPYLFADGTKPETFGNEKISETADAQAELERLEQKARESGDDRDIANFLQFKTQSTRG